MNKILPIILVVVLSGCSNRFSYYNLSGGNLNDLLNARNQCVKELIKSEPGIETKEVDCRAFDICFRSKGWIKTNQAYRGIGVPEKHRFKCTGF
tara:strand:- start:1057 stop:1338 length:282 start_codon:yes stop_codon:yes gene_type:complete